MSSRKKISLVQTRNASRAVQHELHKIGLWGEQTRLFNAEIYWTQLPIFTIPSAAAIFTNDVTRVDKMLGLETGHIYVPQRVIADGLLLERGSLRDIIRHEYGHALAHYYPELISIPRFQKTFGGDYYDYKGAMMERDSYISDYARTRPCEDFAETFMVYLRRGGCMPAKMENKQLIRKWKFIAWLCKKIGGR